jgi:hypothetical protein
VPAATTIALLVNPANPTAEPLVTTAPERLFKAMDADKDGRLTMEEMRTFMQGAGRPAPRQ